MWSNNIDLKINVCITQHTQALRERTLSEGTRITPRTPKRLAVPRLHCGGVCERGVSPNLHSPAKGKKTEYTRFNRDLPNINALPNWKVRLSSLGWPSPCSHRGCIPFQKPSTDVVRGIRDEARFPTPRPAGKLARCSRAMCTHREEDAPHFWEASTSLFPPGQAWVAGDTPGCDQPLPERLCPLALYLKPRRGLRRLSIPACKALSKRACLQLDGRHRELYTGHRLLWYYG